MILGGALSPPLFGNQVLIHSFAQVLSTNSLGLCFCFAHTRLQQDTDRCRKRASVIRPVCSLSLQRPYLGVVAPNRGVHCLGKWGAKLSLPPHSIFPSKQQEQGHFPPGNQWKATSSSFLLSFPPLCPLCMGHLLSVPLHAVLA